jgi:hypothetical protein
MDPYFRGRAWLHRGVTPENIARARLSFNRTHALDLENIYAIVGEAIACALAVALGPHGTRTIALLATSEHAATKALAIAPDSAPAHHAMGLVLTFTKRPPKAWGSLNGLSP